MLGSVAVNHCYPGCTLESSVVLLFLLVCFLFYFIFYFLAASGLHCGIQASLYLRRAGFLSLVVVCGLQSSQVLQFAARGLSC